MKNTLLIAAACSGLSIAGFGCHSSRNSSPTNATISIDASTRELIVGETGTFVARTKDTYGRDARVRWSSTAGDLDTQDDGRVARVRFNETGTYTVKSMLIVDGREIESDMVTVKVKPVP